MRAFHQIGEGTAVVVKEHFPGVGAQNGALARFGGALVENGGQFLADSVDGVDLDGRGASHKIGYDAG